MKPMLAVISVLLLAGVGPAKVGSMVHDLQRMGQCTREVVAHQPADKIFGYLSNCN